MSMLGSGSVIILVVGVLVVVGVVLALILNRGGKRDWAGQPVPPSSPTPAAPYGQGAPTYPTAPPPAPNPTGPPVDDIGTAEPDESPARPEETGPPAPPEPPRSIDDSLRFKEQNRPD